MQSFIFLVDALYSNDYVSLQAWQHRSALAYKMQITDIM